MIRINLCPIDELESPYWYVPDVAVAVVVLVAGYFGANYYLDSIRTQIDEVRASAEELEDSYNKLAPELARFDSLKEDKEKLNERLSSLQKITVSKLQKYKPVIVMEHFHNLKPEGLWYESITINEDASYEVRGGALDNILVAEFMANLDSTEAQQSESSDLRTQVYFESVKLDRTTQDGGGGAFPELSDYPRFVVGGVFAERGEGTSGSNSEESDVEEGSEDGENLSSLFPYGKAPRAL